MSAILFESMTRIARHEAASRAIAGIGMVTESFGNDGTPDCCVNVTMRDTALVLSRVPVATGMAGLAVLPNVNDLVVVLFVGGDLHSAVVVGRLYHDRLDPPPHAGGQIALQLPAGSSEPVLDLLVESDPVRVGLKIDTDVTVEIVRDRVELQVGAMTVSLTSGGGGRAEITAGSSTVTLKADGDITIKSAANLTLESEANMEIKAAGTLTLSGAKVDIN